MSRNLPRRPRRTVLMPAVAAVALVLAACGGDDAGSEPVPDPDPPPTAPPTGETPNGEAPAPALDGREFVSISVEGHDLVEGTVIHLAFADGSVSGNAGCNTIFGEYALDGDRLITTEIGTTDMACEPDLMVQDRWLTDILALEPRLTLAGDTLTMLGAGGATLTLVDRSVAEPDAELTGTRWVLDGIRTQDTVSTVPDGVVASITFADGEALVEAGCNSGSATVEITDDTIVFGPLALTRMLCEPDVMEVEAAVTATLDGPVTYRIDAERLTLDSADTTPPTTADEPHEMLGTGLLLVADD